MTEAEKPNICVKSYAKQMYETMGTYAKAGIFFPEPKPRPIVFPSNWTLPGRCPTCGK